MADIFDEVQEDLRAERARQLAIRYGGAFVTAALLVVAAATGWQAWQWHSHRHDQGAALQYFEAVHQLGNPLEPTSAAPNSAAAADFARLAGAGPQSYRTLAALRAAALRAAAGNRAGAETLYARIADDDGASRLLRDLASLLWVDHALDDGDPAQLAGRLKPLLHPGNPWHALAQEDQALLDLRQGNKKAARQTLELLAQDTTAPQGVRERANGLLGRLGS